MFALNLHDFGVHLYIFFQIAYPFKLKASGWHHVWICLGTSLPSVHSAWSSWSWMTSTSTHAPVDIRWNHLYNILSSDELCCSWIPNMWATVRYCGLCSIASQINPKLRQAGNSSQTSWQSCNESLMWEGGWLKSWYSHAENLKRQWVVKMTVHDEKHCLPWSVEHWKQCESVLPQSLKSHSINDHVLIS